MLQCSIVYALVAVSAMSGQEDTVSLQCLTKNKKVIPLYSQCGQFWTSNVKLPDLLLINRGSEVVAVSGVEITGMAKGRKVATNRIAADVPGFVKQVDEQFKKKLGNGVLDEVLDSRMATAFGVMVFANTKLSGSEAVGPGESAVILLSSGVYFSYTGLSRLDELHVKVSIKQEDDTREILCPVALTPYQSKGDYIFPLRGDLCIVNLPMNIVQHRACLSQEFAIDIMEASPIEDGKPPGIGKPASPKLSGYPIFRREVMAVGNGVVVEIADEFPESLMSDPTAYSEERFEELTAQLEPTIGFTSCVAGNYIVIDHENGEFSFYAHLSEGALRVKPGDRVAQGDVIAAVGNTGHSTQPHLHFQLMDTKDFLTANGLPVMFVNLPPSVINQNCSAANAISATDFIILRIGK
ncbi:MAG: M23 family metallopeptidase [bacterium]|nr:M23 family metallopeptidase [bacterium]